MPVSRPDANNFRDAAKRFRLAEIRLFRLPPTAPETERDRIVGEYIDARAAFDAAGLSVATSLKKRWT